RSHVAGPRPGRRRSSVSLQDDHAGDVLAYAPARTARRGIVFPTCNSPGNLVTGPGSITNAAQGLVLVRDPSSYHRASSAAGSHRSARARSGLHAVHPTSECQPVATANDRAPMHRAHRTSNRVTPMTHTRTGPTVPPKRA